MLSKTLLITFLYVFRTIFIFVMLLSIKGELWFFSPISVLRPLSHGVESIFVRFRFSRRNRKLTSMDASI